MSDGSINPETCPHTWTPVHYVNEGFDVISCGRCDKVLGIEPKEFPNDYEPGLTVVPDPQEELLQSRRQAEAQIQHPSRG